MQISWPLFVNHALRFTFILLNVLIAIIVCEAASPAQTPASGTPIGVVIERVELHSSANKAGLQVGDILLQVADRPINSPFAFRAAEENLVGVPTVMVKVLRGSQELELPLNTGLSGLTVRPLLPPNVLSLYVPVGADMDEKHLEEAIAHWKSALAASEAISDQKTSAWLCSLIALGYREIPNEPQRATHVAEGKRWLLRAWEYVKDGKDKAAQTNLLMVLGITQLNLYDPLGARLWFQQAYPLAVSCGNEIWTADILDYQGLISLSQCVPAFNRNLRTGIALQQMAEAKKYINTALEIRARLTPNSVKRATSITYMALVTHAQRDYESTRKYYQQAREILQRVAPFSADLASVLKESGLTAEGQGELSEARDRMQDAMKVCEKLSPGLRGVPNLKVEVASHLARIGAAMGDLSLGQEYARRSIEMSAALPPDQRLFDVNCFITLGQTSAAQGDLTNAQRQFEQGLALCRKAEPVSPDRGIILDSLALVAFAQNDLDHAEKYCTEAEDLWQKMVLGGLEGRAACLNIQGMITFSKGDHKGAQDRFQRALALWKKSPISSTGVPVSLNGLGNIAVAAGDWTSAEKYYQEERALYKMRNQGGLVVAECLNSLGNVRLLRHNPAAALPFYKEAVQTLEAERQVILDLDTRALFLQQNSSPYEGLLQTYVALKRPAEAFVTLERAHARSLAEKLSERERDPHDRLSVNLVERQKELDNQRHMTWTALQQVRGKHNDKAEKTAEKALKQLDALQRQLDADIRRIHPRAYPRPIDLKSLQQALPTRTLALAYALEGQKVYLFTLTRKTVRQYPILLSRKRLEDAVDNACKIIKNINSLPDRYEQVLEELYRELLAPAQRQIAEAHSLLICPDGFLNRLPFAALMPSHGHFLIERQPLHVVASLTVYKNLLDTRFPANSRALALGNPLAPGREPLPQTRTTALELFKLYSPHAARLPDKAATIANLESRWGQSGVLYLGCHSEADDRNPFGSYLVLTPGSHDNGLLYAWQVLGMKMKANLVVLGACETGLGADTGIEGVQGLARAFEIAGADNVLMTLWKVQDGPTSRLLQDFFKIWKRGEGQKSMAIALREAQIHAIHSDPRPYLWASFVLNGMGR